MIILDTNVLSELMKTAVDPNVANWLRQQQRSMLFTTTVSEPEIAAGIAILPEGRRRRDFEFNATMVFNAFENRVVPFDRAAAKRYARIIGERRQSGRPISTFDAQIAAIALSQGMMLATRNVKDFIDLDLPIIDPWELQK